MQIIYSYVEPWVIEQNVYVMNDGIEPLEQEKVPLENLVEYISVKYNEKKCDKVILYGSNYTYTSQLGEEIKNYSLNNYGVNDINIEVLQK